MPSYRFDAKPNQTLIATRREPLVQLNRDSRNVAVAPSNYGENGLIENSSKKNENEVFLGTSLVRVIKCFSAKVKYGCF